MNDRATHKPARKAPGRPFLPGDPRINRTRPGPGRPPLAYREALRALEPLALRVVEEAMLRGKDSVRLRAAQDTLDRLHGRPAQPIVTVEETREREVLASLSDEELAVYRRVLERLVGGGEAAMAAADGVITARTDGEGGT